MPTESISLEETAYSDQLTTQWNPSLWIGKGMSYKHVPALVKQAFARFISVPADIQSLIPGDSLTIHKLLTYDLPNSNGLSLPLEFSRDTPDIIKIDDIITLTVPAYSVQRQLDDLLPQHWLDGYQSLCSHHTGVKYPLWILCYFNLIRPACEQQLKWFEAKSWLSGAEAIDEHGLADDIDDLLQFLYWRGRFAKTKLCVDELYDILGNNWLTSSILDAIVLQIETRVRSHPELGYVSIANTIFSTSIDTKAWITGSSGTKAFMQNYADRIHKRTCTQLLFPYYSPHSHFAACRIDISSHQIQYGDSLNQSYPKKLFDNIVAWLHYAGEDTSIYSVVDNLPCAKQDDSFSCAIIACNTIAHNVLTEPLWRSEMKRQDRMQIFLQLTSDVDNLVSKFHCSTS